ncbi:GNAT family N-acetyltransferase [Methylibium rhizosphaerae]|uniref:GNAT family N-acetyltransferase n=1 Tax=Methylibium rhizosphaerae TaxID=2570323 RepID=UPI0015E31797|nr:GNAT family N-acetyltransferase [Methylibium rhizosphaerae]
MSCSLIVRQAPAAQAPLLSRLRFEAILAAPGDLTDLQRQLWLDLDPWHAPQEADTSLAAWEGHHLVGAALCRDERLLALYVAPQRWRRNIGTALLRAAEARTRAGGGRHMRLVTLPSALGFYRRHGYQGGHEPQLQWFSTPGAGRPVALPGVSVWRALEPPP